MELDLVQLKLFTHSSQTIALYIYCRFLVNHMMTDLIFCSSALKQKLILVKLSFKLKIWTEFLLVHIEAGVNKPVVDDNKYIHLSSNTKVLVVFLSWYFLLLVVKGHTESPIFPLNRKMKTKQLTSQSAFTQKATAPTQTRTLRQSGTIMLQEVFRSWGITTHTENTPVPVQVLQVSTPSMFTSDSKTEMFHDFIVFSLKYV